MAVQGTRPVSLWAAKIAPLAGGRLPNWNNGNGVPQYRPRMQVQGAVDFGGAHIPGPANSTPVKLYLTVQGVQGSCIYNFGPAFKGRVPDGYYPGWPTEDFTGPSYLDPATAQGSAVLTGFNLVDFPVIFGVMQSHDGHSAGNFYFEYTHIFNTFFAGNIGAGVGRLMPNSNFWSNAEFGPTDTNGGVLVGNGDIADGFTCRILANGVDHGTIGSTGVNGVTVGVAVSILPPPGVLIPSDYHPISMRCVPCAPLFPGHEMWKAFGG